jgi:anti-sigma B factor antagonist
MSTEANFAISETEDRGVAVLLVRGEVDVSTAPELGNRLFSLADEGRRDVVVDLSEVTFVDSTALGVLVGALKRFRSNGGDVRLVVTEPQISKVLEITGLTEVFSIFPTSEEAVGA